MCGRFALDDKVNTAITEFVEQTGRRPDEWSPDWEARWNIAPTENVAVLIDSPKTRDLRFEQARWSLVPPWSDSLKLKFPTFNARTEGIANKSTWAKPVKSTRAIVLASGYYEWTGEKGSKQPWWISPADGLIGFAGLYSWWRDQSKADDDPDRWVLTTTILTCPTIGHLADIHDRNPVTLPQEMWEHWLDPTIVGDQALVDEAVDAHAGEARGLTFHEVAPFKVGDDGPELTARVRGAE
ncbi:SOS response-associated peptidase [Microbacterium halotolerans]|uniref:SOS response-associated peptidase n=1 Tax=Microbacterium halotolerans TaxID=246613 RepID=UPI000E6A9E2F|nr:SOS response-associated peptidase [Microbacterium halotolerans]